ncbi:oligoendopeptidase F [Aneurinibacillus sp. REN35]|uniref:oligoendopeptidase F n=1 Tax=Aneurinibacillus sp. REN35 TaxID=3237286 RepID=UPI00352850BB
MRRRILLPLAGILCGVLLLSDEGVWQRRIHPSTGVTAKTVQESEADRWDLSRLYPTTEDWQKEIEQLKKEIPLLSTYKGKLGDASKLHAMLRKEEEVARMLEKAYIYAQLGFDTDSTDPAAQRRVDEARQTAQKLSLTVSYAAPELMSLSDQELDRMYGREKGLLRYKRYITELRKDKKHVLTEKEERLLALTGEAMGTSSQTYRYLLDTDMIFPSIQDRAGRTIAVDRTSYPTLFTSPDRELRRRAYESVYGTYNQYRNTFASLLQGEVRKHVVYAKARNYPSARYAALHGTEIPERVYDNLIATVRRRLHLLHRYTEVKKRTLRLSTVHKYDLYMPLFSAKKEEYPLTRAKAMVREGLTPLGPAYQKRLDEAFANRSMDVYSRKGKAGGAYQTAVYGYPPYVLLNYRGRLDDVLTMAHELGHAMHSVYANEAQDYLNADYSVFAAEVASTVNESLLLRSWIAQSKQPQEKAALLNRYLDTFQGTLFTQTLFAEFERDIHQAQERGETLNADNLSRRYRKLVSDYYGPLLTVDKHVGMEWARIPHFYKNFYVYQYATGFSAATALADAMLTGGVKERERYLSFLKIGGAEPPLPALAKAGVDLRDPRVIERALDVFEANLNELEQLSKQVQRTTVE